MDAQGCRERRELWEVLERPHHCRVRRRHLARETVPRTLSGEHIVNPIVTHATKGHGTISPLAGQRAPTSILVDLNRLERAYYERKPDTDNPTELVAFGT